MKSFLNILSNFGILGLSGYPEKGRFEYWFSQKTYQKAQIEILRLEVKSVVMGNE